MGDNKRVGVGIIGTGLIAKLHAKGLIKSGLADLRCALSRSAQAFNAFKQELGLPQLRHCSSLDELLADDSISVVDVCTPNKYHAEAAIAAMRAGRDVICEKPLGLNSAEAEEMLRVAKETCRKGMVCFVNRFNPAIRKMKEIIDSGALGRIYLYNSQYYGAGAADPNKPISWRMKIEEAGYGILADMGSHMIDLSRFLLANSQGDISDIIAYGETVHKQRPAKSGGVAQVTNADVCVFQARFHAEALASYSVSCIGPAHRHVIEMVGTEKVLQYDLDDGLKIKIHSYESPGVFRKPPEIILVEPTQGNFHDIEMRRFMECVVNDQPPSPDFHDGMICQRLIDRAMVIR